ncbi:hypothetical protein Tco_1345160 [Tanacetum coccineum]
MLLDNSDNLNISDADPLDPSLEATTLPKFDMHLYKSSMSETHVKWLIKCYKIPEELHPRVVPEGMTMDELPNDVIRFLKKWKDNFFLVDRRASPFAMPWRHRDSSVADPFPKFGEFSESDVERLREVVITLHKPSPSLLYSACLSHSCKHVGHVSILKDPKGKVFTMAEFLRLPNFRGCKVAASTLLPPGTARVTHLTPLLIGWRIFRQRRGDMEVAEMPCRKVLAKKEKKKKKSEVKAAAKANDSDQAEKVAGKKCAGKEGTSWKKKRKIRLETPTINLDSKHNAFAGQLDALRNQTDEQSPPRHDVIYKNVDEHMVDMGAGNEHGDENIVDEGHGDNTGGLSGLCTQPSPANQSGM